MCINCGPGYVGMNVCNPSTKISLEGIKQRPNVGFCTGNLYDVMGSLRIKQTPPRTSCDCPPNKKGWGIGSGCHGTCGICGVSFVTDMETFMRPLEINHI